eukprot:2108926-Amphidinium_carterae.5
MLETDAERMESLVDTLAEMATGTIHIRALGFSKYLLWAQNLGVDHDSVTEAAAYQFMVHLRNSGAAKTTLRRFLESAAFAKHILGWSIEDEVLNSRRLKGAAFRCLRDVPPVRRSQPFLPGLIAAKPTWKGSFLLFMYSSSCTRGLGTPTHKKCKWSPLSRMVGFAGARMNTKLRKPRAAEEGPLH